MTSCLNLFGFKVLFEIPVAASVDAASAFFLPGYRGGYSSFVADDDAERAANE